MTFYFALLIGGALFLPIIAQADEMTQNNNASITTTAQAVSVLYNTDGSIYMPANTTQAFSVDPGTEGMSWWAKAKYNIVQTWNSPHYELYIPAHTWHNRRMYTAEKIASYNENPWGIGIGKYRYDRDGDKHGLYIMEFLDSHDRVEVHAGYSYEKMWRPLSDKKFRIGAGFTGGFLGRQDYLHYVPVPFVVPILSFEYGPFSIQSTYIPGGKGNGNVLFTWLRWEF